ncbi:hypothetical protein Hanom_Chr09g00783641 [Helianthus anomalus]
MIREVLQLNDQDTDPIELPAGTVEAVLARLSYEGKYPSLKTEEALINITQSAALTCLITNEPFNYSKYIFEGMKRNVTGVRKDKFLMYPRFLQMIVNARYPELLRSGNTLELKPMGPACFGALTPKKGTEKRFEGLIPLGKFGQFAETKDVVPVDVAQVNAPLNAMVAEEHDIQGVAEDDEGLEIMCDSGDDEELPPESEADTVVSTVHPVISAENLALLLKSVTDKMGNPPSNLLVPYEEPSENPKDPDSLLLKRKGRDPRLRMYVEQNKDQPMNVAEDDDGLYDFDFEKNVTVTTTATEDIFEFNVDT